MRYAPEHKRQTRERLLHTAARLFRQRGYAATGVDAVVADANLTAGALYAHFDSKETLLAEALDAAFRESGGQRPASLDQQRGRAWMRSFVSFYLSPEHRDHPELGCPMPALGPEIWRIGKPVRVIFERHLRGLFSTIAERLYPKSPDPARAIPAVAMCVGSLVLARAVEDRKLSDQILKECRDALLAERVFS